MNQVIIQCNTCGARATVAPGEPCVEEGCAGMYVCEVITPASLYAEHMGRRELDDAWRCDEALAALDAQLEGVSLERQAELHTLPPGDYVVTPAEMNVLGGHVLRPRRLPRLFRWIRGNR